MRLSRQFRAFLARVCGYNQRFNAVQMGTATKRLYHPFWTSKEITAAEAVKADWDVPDHIVPFYGDWHDLFCLDTATGAVVCLDDDRRVHHSWDSTDEFDRCLTRLHEGSLGDDSGIVDVWLDD